MRIKLCKLRQDRGLTQAQLAAVIRVSQGTIAHWESGRAVPDGVNRRKLADFFGIPESALLDGYDRQEVDIQAYTDALRALHLIA
ncbi:MAG: helix-turn-helix domain-containing protein [Oscillospiraceae bacterium]|nr:helix-turn-helix domain-containing protein [Oscillospiraceae bacterium]